MAILFLYFLLISTDLSIQDSIPNYFNCYSLMIYFVSIRVNPRLLLFLVKIVFLLWLFFFYFGNSLSNLRKFSHNFIEVALFLYFILEITCFYSFESS